MATRIIKVIGATGSEQLLTSTSAEVDFKKLTMSDAPSGNTDLVNKLYADTSYSASGHNHGSTYIASSEKGAASGVCPLDANTKVSATYLPSYVDDVLEYANFAALPTVGAAASVVYDTVTFTAVNRGTAGNSIALVFNGTDDLTTVVGAWNSANPSNTVGFTGQAGSYVPAAGTATLTGGVNTLAENGKIYIAIDTGKSWRFSGTIYTEIIASPGTTDNVPQGVTNLYFTEAGVRSTVLTGLSTTAGNAAATDTVLQAIGKLEGASVLNTAKVSFTEAGVRSTVLTGLDTTAGNVAATDTVLQAIGKLEGALNAKASFNDQFYSETNKESSAITYGKIVYASAAGEVRLAQANAAATCDKKPIGVVYETSIAADAQGRISFLPSYISATGLTAGAPVYLSPSAAGGITQTYPTTATQFVVKLGKALTTTTWIFNPEDAMEIL